MDLCRGFVVGLVIALVGLGCDEGGGSGKDDGIPAGPGSTGRIVLRSAQLGGSGAISLSSTAADPRIGGGSASLGQVGPVGIAGGGLAPTLLAGFWPVAVRAVGSGDVDDVGEAAPLSVGGIETALTEPRSLGSVDYSTVLAPPFAPPFAPSLADPPMDASGNAMTDPRARVGGPGAFASADADSAASDPSELSEVQPADQGAAAVPVLSLFGRLVLLLCATAVMMMRARSVTRRIA